MGSPAASPVTSTPHQGEPMQFLGGRVKVVVVHIERDSSGIPTDIVHPGDASIRYWTGTGHSPKPNPNLAHEVLWVADNLLTDETLTIRVKPKQTHPFFEWGTYILDATHRAASSGPVKYPPPAAVPPLRGWGYNIELSSPLATVPIIDPTIIIDPEP